jgi:hypothetical protein
VLDLAGLWRRARAPEKAFRELAAGNPRLGPSLVRLLLLRAPVACAEGLFLYWGILRLYRAAVDLGSPLWARILPHLPPELPLEELQGLLDGAPAFPTLAKVLPWLLLAAPIYVLSLWIHDAVWDHGCLWLFRGVKRSPSFGTTLLAEAEALQVGVLGALAGLLTSLPGVGWLLYLPVSCVGAYFWILRGVALAAFHDCPVWKGILATIVHAMLMACFLAASAGLVILMLAQGLA